MLTKKSYLPYIFILTNLALFYLLNAKTHFWADDFFRMNANSISEAAINARNEYFSWTGRFFVAFSCYAFFGNKVLQSSFDLINALFTVTTLVLFSYFFSNIKVFSKSFYLLFSLNIFFILSVFQSTGESIFWKTGSFNYNWVLLFQLVFFMPFYESLFNGKKISLNIKVFSIICCIISAGSLEHLSIALICASALAYLLLYKNIQDKKDKIFLFFLFFLEISGFLISILAPGNSVRSNMIPDRGFYWNFIAMFLTLGYSYLYCLVGIIVLMINILFFNKIPNEIKKIQFILIVSILIGNIALGFSKSPAILNRKAFPLEMIFLLVFNILSRPLLDTISNKKQSLALFFALTMACISYFNTFRIFDHFDIQIKKRLTYLEQFKEIKVDVIYVDSLIDLSGRKIRDTDDFLLSVSTQARPMILNKTISLLDFCNFTKEIFFNRQPGVLVVRDIKAEDNELNQVYAKHFSIKGPILLKQ